MEEKKFKTKTGYCHILPDKIMLTRDGIIGNVAEITNGSNITRILVIYGILAALFAYQAFDNYQRRQILPAILFSLLAIYLIYGIFNSLNNSAARVIEKASIRNVKFKKGITGITRPRFEIYFENTNGKLKKRLILLPGTLSATNNDITKALNIMTEEGLLGQSQIS